MIPFYLGFDLGDHTASHLSVVANINKKIKYFYHYGLFQLSIQLYIFIHECLGKMEYSNNCSIIVSIKVRK